MAHCDNHAICNIWRKGSFKNRDLVALVWSFYINFYYIAASYNFNIIVVHMPGHGNSIADSISSLQMERFWQLVPEALMAM